MDSVTSMSIQSLIRNYIYGSSQLPSRCFDLIYKRSQWQIEPSSCEITREIVITRREAQDDTLTSSKVFTAQSHRLKCRDNAKSIDLFYDCEEISSDMERFVVHNYSKNNSI
eukprot:TRINITY_DN885_c0_g1_i1.p1 TRINITY_DN885_c0_g1~~TRINITY_DN885_c0_g1_i1.p1  ORF type:complete len:112 (-),score=6.73 TRINITY_DN885_c0_g1_i1:156-491(-)